MRDTFAEEQYLKEAQELNEIQEKLLYLTKIKEQKVELLKSICAGIPRNVNGYEFKAITRKGSVQFKLIPELKTIDLDQYRSGDITYWKLNHIKQFEEII